MTAQAKIGGVNREALLRLWFWFYVWACLGCVFQPQETGRWFAWMLGSGLTCILLYRHSVLAGIVGYLVAATATVLTLPAALSLLGAFFSGRLTDASGARFAGGVLVLVYRYAALAFVPTVVLALHVATRHRLQRSFEASVAPLRHGHVVAPGAYYFVTFR